MVWETLWGGLGRVCMCEVVGWGSVGSVRQSFGGLGT